MNQQTQDKPRCGWPSLLSGWLGIGAATISFIQGLKISYDGLENRKIMGKSQSRPCFNATRNLDAVCEIGADCSDNARICITKTTENGAAANPVDRNAINHKLGKFSEHIADNPREEAWLKPGVVDKDWIAKPPDLSAYGWDEAPIPQRKAAPRHNQT